MSGASRRHDRRPFPAFFPFELTAAAVREQEFARLAAAAPPTIARAEVARIARVIVLRALALIENSLTDVAATRRSNGEARPTRPPEALNLTISL